METLKETIQRDFIISMKEKNEIAKSALSGVKAKITEAEKETGLKDLSDPDVLKVLIKAIKQRKESYDIFKKAGRTELAEKELGEYQILEKYMPPQMEDSEIESVLSQIISVLDSNINRQIIIGKAIGSFNKEYKGRADMERVIQILEKLLH